MKRPEEYELMPGVSQSDLKVLEEDPFRFFKTIEAPDETFMKMHGLDGEKKSKSFALGDIFDICMTSPEQVYDHYVYTDFKASGFVQEAVDKIYAYNNDPTYAKQEHPRQLSEYRGMILEYAKSVSYQKIGQKGGWGEDTVFNKVVNDGQAYYDQLWESKGKRLLKMQDLTKAKEMQSLVESDPVTRDIAKTVEGDQCQLALQGEWNGVKIKGLLDKARFNHKESWIQPIDYKTAATLKQFWKNYFEYRYYRQGAQYTELLRQNYPGYTIRPFGFVVAFTASDTVERPKYIEMCQNDLKVGYAGGHSKASIPIMGFTNLVEDLKWHRQTGLWEHSRSYYENGRLYADFFAGSNGEVNLSAVPISEMF